MEIGVEGVVVVVKMARRDDDGKGRVAERCRGLVRAELVVARQRRVGARSVIMARRRHAFRSSRHMALL